MTTITLTNGYYIEIDPLNYTLRQKYTGETKSGEKRKRRQMEICGRSFPMVDGG